MLLRFSVTNFRCFENRIELNLADTRNFEFNTFAIKNNIIKNGIIYGENGSGKSNLGLAIFDIVFHLTQKFKSPNFLQNYTFAGKQNELVKFEYSFKFDNEIIDYVYSKDFRGALVEEKLLVNSCVIFDKKKDDLFIDTEAFPLEEKQKLVLTNNANNISIINFFLTSYPLSSSHYLIKLMNFVNSMLWFRSLEDKEFIGLESSIYLIDEYIIRNNYVEEFSKFIEKVSGQHFDFVLPQEGERLLKVYIKDTPQLFNVIASTGTHALTLLFFWIKHFEKASFVFIDEFDAFYHFKLSFDVCSYLFQQNCQLFLSSHNTFLMTNDLLRPDCNFILKDYKITSLVNLTDKELREGHNIEKLYRGGTFNL